MLGLISQAGKKYPIDMHTGISELNSVFMLLSLQTVTASSSTYFRYFPPKESLFFITIPEHINTFLQTQHQLKKCHDKKKVYGTPSHSKRVSVQFWWASPMECRINLKFWLIGLPKLVVSHSYPSLTWWAYQCNHHHGCPIQHFNLCAPFSCIMQSHYITTPQMVANFNWKTGFTHKNPQHTTQFFEGQNFLHCCHQTSNYPMKSVQLTDWLVHNPLHATPTTCATSYHKIKCLIKNTLQNMVPYFFKMPCNPPSKHIFFFLRQSFTNLSLSCFHCTQYHNKFLTLNKQSNCLMCLYMWNTISEDLFLTCNHICDNTSSECCLIDLTLLNTRCQHFLQISQPNCDKQWRHHAPCQC